MTTYTGSSPSIQRKVRRAWEYLVNTGEWSNDDPDEKAKMHYLLKAIFIADNEDLVDNSQVISGEINIDDQTLSTLPPMPFDPDAPEHQP